MKKGNPIMTRASQILWRFGGFGGTLALVVFAFGLGFLLRGAPAPPQTEPVESHEEMDHSDQGQAQETIWTCAMHPQVRLLKPGKCPICAMNLVALQNQDAETPESDRIYKTSEAARALMDIQTSPVQRRFVPVETRMVGKVDYDETKIGHITAWVPGRIDRLYVDFTGINVKKGDHMVRLFSPDLLTAQEELYRAAKAIGRLSPDAGNVLRSTTRSALEGAREKLRRWGLTPEQIQEAENNGVSSDHVTIYAPMGGTVIEKEGQEGIYVHEGSRIYTIADLTKVWVFLNAYESDLQWLHLGQEAEFSTEAYPGEVFRGKIAFIDPVLDKKTRTAKVRLNVDNTNGKLKPEMFVRAIVHAQIATKGRVMDPGLVGKWISPMHPEIVKDGPGECDICGMPLKRAEDLGYVPASATDEDKPLVIPASAPLLTGTRAIVYVDVPGQEKPTFEGREVVLGARAGEYYIVRSGLNEGERVVTNGNFKIDSALQIMAKPSMMSPESGPAPQQGHAHH